MSDKLSASMMEQTFSPCHGDTILGFPGPLSCLRQPGFLLLAHSNALTQSGDFHIYTLSLCQFSSFWFPIHKKVAIGAIPRNHFAQYSEKEPILEHDGYQEINSRPQIHSWQILGYFKEDWIKARVYDLQILPYNENMTSLGMESIHNLLKEHHQFHQCVLPNKWRAIWVAWRWWI